jgi:AbrB family looped-hinge helix DNA binding protein
MHKGKVSQRGQLVVPAAIRREMNIGEGTVVSFSVRESSIIVTPLTDDLADSYMGFLGRDSSASAESIRARHNDAAVSDAKTRKAGRR